MTTQQPEALRIADELENTRIDGASAECFYTLCRAADLLRLLHARVQEVGAVAKREHARVQELERELSSIGAGGVEPLRQRGSCWLPVAERLPEPGTPVLLDIGKRFPIRAMWAAKHTVEAPPEQVDIDWGDYDGTTDTYYSPEGWYEWNEHEECHWFVHDAPRAWMALPEQVRARGAQGESHDET